MKNLASVLNIRLNRTGEPLSVLICEINGFWEDGFMKSDIRTSPGMRLELLACDYYLRKLL